MEDMHTRGMPIAKQPALIVFAVFVTIIPPLIAALYVIYKIVTNDFTWLELGFLIFFEILSLLGTGLGLHRYFSHHSFTANKFLKYMLGIFGCAGGLGPITWFSAVHRRHHRFADSTRDPHTPHFPEWKNPLQFLKTAWMSALGFSFRFGTYSYYLSFPERDVEGVSTEFRNSVQDLQKDPEIDWIDRRYYLWMILGWIVPGFLMVAITRDWRNFGAGFIWGGFARMSFNQLIFGFINITGHLKGHQPFQSNDESRNVYWFALFSSGESLHNNHHAFPWTAKTTLAWWQLDLNYYFLALFEKLGWATEVRRVTAAEMAKKKRVTTST